MLDLGPALNGPVRLTPTHPAGLLRSIPNAVLFGGIAGGLRCELPHPNLPDRRSHQRFQRRVFACPKPDRLCGRTMKLCPDEGSPPMSIEAIHYVMKTDIPDGIAKLVAFVIADYAHSETGQAWPKIETLARKCSQSVRTVQRKVRVLEEMGVLRVEQRHTEAGRQRENLFVLYLPGVPRPAANDPAPALPMGDTQSPIPTRKRFDPVTPEGVSPVTPEGDTAVTPRGIHQKESPRGIHSEPVGSAPQGGPAPRDFQSDLRSRGVETLRDLTGWNTARAHSRIGQWLSEAGDDAGMVLAVIDEAVEAKPIDASGWIAARLKRRKAEAAPAHQSPRH
ncbi:helix-turn-helix domain-containing protein, partial [Methylobacterium sp. WL6]|uniref:helix-turn-helix domain-containing protein n=1 Tax=Methylobacterium sp. WL6 TaxID=2603901 RepID=UPI0011CADC76